MTTPARVTFSSVRKALRNANCAYLYSDGDLLIRSEEKFKGKTFDTYIVVKGFIPAEKVSVSDYSPYREKKFGGNRVETLMRVVIRQDAFGLIALHRPERAEICINACSPSSEKSSLGNRQLRLKYGGGIETTIGYLSRVGDDQDGGHHLISSSITVQTDVSALDGEVDETHQLWTLDEVVVNEQRA